MKITARRTETILRVLQEKHDAEHASEYGEPRYTNPENGILFANWNDVSKRACAYLEEAGYALEWSDEWTVVYEHGDKAYRTSPDSYGWMPTAVLPPESCEYLTPDDGADAAIEAFAHHSLPVHAVPYWVSDADLETAGFVLHADKLESGFHQGQNDDPQAIAKALLDSGKASRVVGRVDGKGQFDVRFSIWIEPAAID